MSEPIEAAATEVDEPKQEPEAEPERKDEQPGATISALPVVVDERSRAIDRAADMAAQTVVAGRDEFMSLAQQARILSMSGLAPKQVRGNPYVAFHLALIGRDMQLSPTAAMELVDIIGEGDDARPSLSPELMIGRVRKMGLGSIRPLLRTLDRCVAVALSPDWQGFINPVDGTITTERGYVLGTTEFTWEEARIAGLVDVRCASAGEHWRAGDGKQRSQRCDCRKGWQTYPKRMLWWRAAGYCVDDYFPEASIGLYSPEELGAIVDDEGRAIDPTTAALPDGYDRKSVARAQQAAEGSGLSDEERDALDRELMELQVILAALPADRRSAIKSQWAQNGKLKGWKVWDLTQPLANLARAMVNGHVAAAVKEGWDRDDAIARTVVEFGDCVAVALLAVPDEQPKPDATPDEQPPAEAVPDTKPEGCALCGSERAELVEVHGVKRCRNATECAKRIERKAAEAVAGAGGPDAGGQGDPAGDTSS